MIFLQNARSFQIGNKHQERKKRTQALRGRDTLYVMHLIE